MKRIGPYQQLQERVKQWLRPVVYPSRVTMWVYPKDKLNTGWWELTSLYERVLAADQLGFDVMLLAKEDGLRVEYITRPDRDLPYWLS